MTSAATMAVLLVLHILMERDHGDLGRNYGCPAASYLHIRAVLADLLKVHHLLPLLPVSAMTTSLLLTMDRCALLPGLL
jgi:hypothetical protein